MTDDRLFKELDRIQDAIGSVDTKVATVDGKLDKLRDEVYGVGKIQERYAERVDNLVTRVTTVENEQKLGRRVAITTLMGVILTLLSLLGNAIWG